MADFSSYVTIQVSKLVPLLTLTNAEANSGSYNPQPPQTIEPGTTANFQLHDPSGPYGSDGSVSYNGQGISLSAGYACAYWSSNTGEVGTGGAGGFVADWYVQTDDDCWTRQQVPSRGHPLRLFIAVRAASEPVVGPPG
jgi:hypothetical protein